MTIKDYVVCGICLIDAVLIFLCFVRAVIGPKHADRIVAVNMMGTIINVLICGLGVFLNQGYLIDIAIIYAVISFLAVVVISKMYIGVYNQKETEASNSEETEQ